MIGATALAMVRVWESSLVHNFGAYAYNCSKHGVIELTRNASAILGRYGIRVNGVSPYAVHTAMSKEASDESKYVSSHDLVVDGDHMVHHADFCTY
ncbi:hypothetical protein K1719_037293 [Acacia pycnantha]|nr:hypothetical protein K1719_037293 [Acacia pycnantha]